MPPGRSQEAAGNRGPKMNGRRPLSREQNSAYGLLPHFSPHGCFCAAGGTRFRAPARRGGGREDCMEADERQRLAPFLEKVSIFSEEYLMCCKYVKTVAPGRETLTKKFYMHAGSAARLLEDLLDFHGAKDNGDWYYYRELSAAVRHLAGAAYAQKHIFNRFPHYGLPDLESFEDEGHRTHDYLAATLKRLAPAVTDEAKRLSIRVPRRCYTPENFPRISTPVSLPADIDEAENAADTRNIVKMAGEFLGVADSFEEVGISMKLDPCEMDALVPGQVNEVEVRRHGMVVHNLQSTFDSYIVHGATREPATLKTLRGYFSVVLHLLDLTGTLLHFFERHILERGVKDRHKRVRVRIAELVSPNALLDRTLNYGLYYASLYLADGRALAEKIRDEHIKIGRITVGVPRDLGFHTRPSLLVSRIVDYHGGRVNLVVGEKTFDASRPVMLQYGGGEVKRLDLAEVVFEGNLMALEDIKILASVNYGEDQIGRGIPLPRELSYLM